MPNKKRKGPTQPRKPQVLATKPAMLDIASDRSRFVMVDETGVADVARKTEGPVGLADREGVFVHSFKCQVCDLEFALGSWVKERAAVRRTFCPECGKQTPMAHWLLVTSTSKEMTEGGRGSQEIHQTFPVGGRKAELRGDTENADDSRYV